MNKPKTRATNPVSPAAISIIVAVRESGLRLTFHPANPEGKVATYVADTTLVDVYASGRMDERAIRGVPTRHV